MAIQTLSRLDIVMSPDVAAAAHAAGLATTRKQAQRKLQTWEETGVMARLKDNGIAGQYRLTDMGRKKYGLSSPKPAESPAVRLVK